MAIEELDPTQGEPEGETVASTDEVVENEHENEASAAEADEGTGEADKAAETVAEEEKPKPTEKKKLPWEIKRINEETNKRRELERRVAQVEAENARLRGGKPETKPEDNGAIDVEAIRNEERERIRREVRAEADAASFDAACNRTFDAGMSAFGNDFEHARDTLVNALGDQIKNRPEFLQTITELDNGHQVFYELGRHPEEAERILSLPQTKMVLELAKLGVTASKPAAPKPISKAPAPVSPIGGATKTSGRLDDEEMPMDEWAKKYLGQVARR